MHLFCFGNQLKFLLVLLLIILSWVGCDNADEGEDTSSDTDTDTDSDSDSDTDTDADNLHESCKTPLPDPMPSLPDINVDTTNRPMFDYWRDLECEDVQGYFCSQPTDSCDDAPDMDECFTLEPGGTGVCSYIDIDVWCDGEGEVISYEHGMCWICMPVEAHAAACCNEIEGVDCREWPYPADGAPGLVCARHEDCEPGLICGPPTGSGYGICMCPEAYDTEPDQPSYCWSL